MAKKSTQAQFHERIRIVFELILSGTPRVDIIRYSSDNWGVTSRQCEKYIAKATLIIKEQAANIMENAFEDHLVMRDSLRQAALKDGDKRLAHEILRDTAKLLGLYAPKQLEVWTKTLPDNFSESEAVRQFKKVMDEERKNKVEE